MFILYVLFSDQVVTNVFGCYFENKSAFGSYELCKWAESDGLWAPKLQVINHEAFQVMNCF